MGRLVSQDLIDHALHEVEVILSTGHFGAVEFLPPRLHC
jgi:hypothetical protein